MTSPTAALASASPNAGSERAIARWRRMISGMRLMVDMAGRKMAVDPRSRHVAFRRVQPK